MNETMVVVSRQWNNPTITAFVDVAEVGAKMTLDEFLRTLVEVNGNPSRQLIMTKAQLLSKLQAALTITVLR